MGGENSVPRKAFFKREFVLVEITMCRFFNTTLSQVPEFLQFHFYCAGEAVFNMLRVTNSLPLLRGWRRHGR
jgi:hypothetical protein